MICFRHFSLKLLLFRLLFKNIESLFMHGQGIGYFSESLSPLRVIALMNSTSVQVQMTPKSQHLSIATASSFKLFMV